MLIALVQSCTKCPYKRSYTWTNQIGQVNFNPIPNLIWNLNSFTFKQHYRPFIISRFSQKCCAIQRKNAYLETNWKNNAYAHRATSTYLISAIKYYNSIFTIYKNGFQTNYASIFVKQCKRPLNFHSNSRVFVYGVSIKILLKIRHVLRRENQKATRTHC